MTIIVPPDSVGTFDDLKNTPPRRMPFVMDVVMRQVFPAALLVALTFPAASLFGDEPRAKDPSVDELIKQLGDKDPEKVCAAAKALGRLGPAAKDAVPALKTMLKNRDGRIRWTAAEALWVREHKASDLVPVYSELLAAKDEDVRAASAWRLGRLGSEARPAVLLLAGALRDESVEVRVQSGQALANLAPYAEAVLPALVRALGDERLDDSGPGDRGWESVRTSPALPALVEMADESIPLLLATFRERAPEWPRRESSGPRAGEVAGRVAHALPAFGGRAVAPLLQALESKDAKTRGYAVLALREVAQFNGLPEAAVNELEKCLDDSDKSVRLNAANALSWVRPSSTKAIAVLAKAKEERFGIDSSELLGDLDRMCPHNEAAVKLLLRMLGDDRAETAREAHRILANLSLPADQVLGAWTKAMSHADPEVRSKAVWALRDLGPSAKPAKAALRERFAKEDDYNCKDGIMYALVAIDPDDPALVPFLVRALDDRDRSVSLNAVRCLDLLGPRAKEAIPAIEARLLKSGEGDKDAFWDGLFASDAVTAIVRIAPGSEKSAATLLKALRHRDIRSIVGAKNSFYMRDVLEDELQANLPAAAPLLREALKDEDADVRKSAALVLVRAGLEIETALPVLMEKWSGKDEEQRRFQWRVVKVLMRRQMPATPAVAAAWCKAWQDGDPEVREILEPGLFALQPESLPHLLDQLRQAKTPQTKRDLAHLLANFEGQGKQVLPILREELRETQPADQYAAAKALMTLGPDAAEAVPELARLLSSPHPGIRAAAAQALGRAGRAARPAVPALKAMLKEDEPKMRIVAADALSQIDPDVSEALALLRDVFVSQKYQGSWRIVPSIDLPEGVKDRSISVDPFSERNITRYGERAVPVLADLLENVDLDEWSADNVSAQCGANARVQAALLLAKLGPEAKAAVPALVRALKDRDPFVRDAAASALGRIGPAAKEAAPEFITLLEQQNRFASGAGTWSSGARAGGRSRDAGRFEYKAFDFRSAGRGSVLSRNADVFGYGYGYSDPYASVRPAYPYDPAHVLSRIDSEARSALPILSEMAKNPDHPGRLSAALALWRSGCESPDLVPAFAAALEAHAKIAKDERVPLPPELRECLAELDTQLKPAVGVLANWLKRRASSGEQEDQVAVVEALGRLGGDARAAAELLRPMLDDDGWKPKRRVAAALALYQIRGEKQTGFPALREVLLGLEEHSSIYHRADPTDTARVRAARALGVLAEDGDERAHALILEAAKGDENPYVRVAALEALARQKETNAAAMRGLCAMLRHPNDTVRLEVASACGRLGPRAKVSRKALQVATEDGQLAVRQAASQALASLD
jgi:HEAT repeat protein